MTREPSIHWAGGLDYPVRGGIMVMSPGYPCCCSGDRARKIREDGTQAWDRERVTCKTCLRLLAKKAAAVEFSRQCLSRADA